MGTSPMRNRPLDALPCAAAYVDGDGNVLGANDAFRSLWHQCGGRDPIEGHALFVLFVDGDRESVREAVVRSVAQSRTSACAARLASSLATLVIESAPAGRARRRPTMLVTLRSPQQERDQTDDGALRAAMTAGVVHDLKARVQVLLGWTSLLKRHRDNPDRIDAAVRVIERNGALLSSLLEDLLMLARPVWIRANLRRERLDLPELVQAEIRAVEPLAAARGVRVSVAAESAPIAVDGDEVHLRRVVNNLVANAVKFTPHGGTVGCRVWRSERWAGLAVRDTGRGISPEFLPHVFDPFQQASDESHTDEGLGLGLAVVRYLVELHGGMVMAESAGDGRGSTFTVLLPAVRQQAPSRASSVPAALDSDRKCAAR